MQYRSDIDGLRAIAILFVLLFHGGITLFPSGFIGVDIFFVISGFLITHIIHNSLERNRFSFRAFYTRRLWRLQPLVICLIISTICFTLFFYLPEDLLPYFKSARKTSLFISNAYFEQSTKGYFSANANQLPLLHTWSLSIEWQCYLILPAVIYFLYRVCNKQHLPKIFYLLTLIFFALSLFLSRHIPVKTYYCFTSRIFEFLIGACIVFDHSRFAINKYVSELVCFSALICLFYIAMSHGISPGFPNGYALMVCIATAILIAAGTHNSRSLSTQLLSLKPLVYTGLISYSLYIWHWPIFALMHYLELSETPLILLLVFIFIFIIATLSWRFIEKPAQKFNTIKFTYSITYLVLLPIFFLHLSGHFVKKYQGYPQRFAETTRIAARLHQYTAPQRESCLRDKISIVRRECTLGSKNPASKKAFMFGDSHANHLWRFMDILAQEADISVRAHSTAACLTLPGLRQNNWHNETYTACHAQIKRYYAMVKKNHYDFVILGQNWDGYMGTKLLPYAAEEILKIRIEKALDKALRVIIATGAKPVLLKSIVASNSYTCFLNHIKHRKTYHAEECDFDLNQHKSQWQEALFTQMQKKHPQLIVIDPSIGQCPQGLCKAAINGIPVFRDSAHLTDYAAYHFAKNYLKQQTNPLIT